MVVGRPSGWERDFEEPLQEGRELKHGPELGLNRQDSIFSRSRTLPFLRQQSDCFEA